ncbi:hypothetical protein C0Q70_09067 [Pomacea canaliculata]|uniref:AP3A hydrolase n=1 Tax=Pomacea canaliculata TaxID=400727 RepID=A0A2T7P8S4_POMCA|nr:hypothetical protein C0Q70_09067 [Pomacea canaliculata]
MQAFVNMQVVVATVVMVVAVVLADRYSGKVLLVSMDGFRWDYITKVSNLTNFPRMAASGVAVDYVNNTFVTKTFPCHYTIVTGLYEESHGIVANRMYDPDHNASFTMSSTESFWWEGGEPVWVTADKQNKKTGVYFWPGSEAEIRGRRPQKWFKYNESVPFNERVATAIGWFTEDNMDFVAMYFNEPVREMDQLLGNILDTIDSKGLRDTVNVIVTSDHGMTRVDSQNKVSDRHMEVVDSSMIQRVVDSGVITAIIPAEGQEQEVVDRLNNQSHVTVYQKEKMPDHFHYKNNPRITPIIVMADEGWQLTSDIASVRRGNTLGEHGYSNELPSMKPIFFARGPNFQTGVRTTSIRSVDIYPLVCKLLNIDAAPNNGSLDNTASLLKSSTNGGVSPFLVDRQLAAVLALNVALVLWIV